MGESTRFGGDFERLFASTTQVALDVAGFAVDVGFVDDAILGVDGVLPCDAALLFDAIFGDPIFEEVDFVVESACTFDLAETFFGSGIPGADADFEGSTLGLACGRAAISGVPCCAAGFFEDVALDGFDFEGNTTVFAGEPVVAAFIGAAIVTGFDSGTIFIGDAFVVLVPKAVNCPLAI